MTNLKIVIIGSQCTGKSTLSKAISEELNLPLITEAAREFKREQLNPQNPEYPQIQKQILKLQIQKEGLHSSFVSDRSSLDNLAYHIYGCADKISDEDNLKYISDALYNTWNYTHIFYLRPEFRLVEDGFRECDPIYQLKIDTIIDTLLKLYNIKHYKLTGTLENRTKKAMEIIQKW